MAVQVSFNMVALTFFSIVALALIVGVVIVGIYVGHRWVSQKQVGKRIEENERRKNHFKDVK